MQGYIKSGVVEEKYRLSLAFGKVDPGHNLQSVKAIDTHPMSWIVHELLRSEQLKESIAITCLHKKIASLFRLAIVLDYEKKTKLKMIF